jgi:hypothetical protein
MLPVARFKGPHKRRFDTENAYKSFEEGFNQLAFPKLVRDLKEANKKVSN